MNDLLKNVAIGLFGGMAGTAAMRLYWVTAERVVGEDPRRWTRNGRPRALDEMAVVGQHHEEGESSTAAAGREAYETVTGTEPDPETKSTLSYAVHWGYGAAMGALYGALRDGERQEDLDVPGGLTYGTALWLFGDELMVPLLGLSQGATAYPLAQHVHRWGAHLTYGLALATTVQAGHILFDRKAPRGASRSWMDLAWQAGKIYLQWRAGKRAVATVLRTLQR